MLSSFVRLDLYKTESIERTRIFSLYHFFSAASTFTQRTANLVCRWGNGEDEDEYKESLPTKGKKKKEKKNKKSKSEVEREVF